MLIFTSFLLLTLFQSEAISAKQAYKEGIDKINEDSFRVAYPKMKLALTLFEEKNNQEGMAKALMALGYINEQVDTLGAAVMYYFEALKFNPDLYHELSCYKNLGKIYKGLHKYAEAKDFYKKALTLARKHSQTETAGVLYNLGNLMKNQGDLLAAKNYYLEALTLSEKHENTSRVNRILNALGLCYKDLGEYEKAREYYAKVLEKSVNDSEMGRSYHNIAWSYLMEKDYHESIKFNRKALEFKNPKERSITYIDLGLAYEALGDLENAASHWKMAIFNGIDQNRPEELVVYKHLSLSFKDDSALFHTYNDQYIALLEQFYQQRKEMDRLQIVNAFDLEVRRYRELALRKQRNRETLIWTLSSLAAVLLVTLTILYYYRAKRKATEKAVREVLRNEN